MAEKTNRTLDGGLRLCQCDNYAVGSNDFVEDDTSTGLYCSSYCRRFYGDNMVKVNPIGKDGKVSKHHTGIKVYPKLDHSCDYCGTHMLLTYSNATKNGSKRFSRLGPKERLSKTPAPSIAYCGSMISLIFLELLAILYSPSFEFKCFTGHRLVIRCTVKLSTILKFCQLQTVTSREWIYPLQFS